MLIGIFKCNMRFPNNEKLMDGKGDPISRHASNVSFVFHLWDDDGL